MIARPATTEAPWTTTDAAGRNTPPSERSTSTVAQAVVDLATESPDAPGPADAPIVEIAGPRDESIVEIARLLLARRGDTSRIEAVSNPDDPDYGLNEAGALLPGPGATLAGPTFAEWLDAQQV